MYTPNGNEREWNFLPRLCFLRQEEAIGGGWWWFFPFPTAYCLFVIRLDVFYASHCIPNIYVYVIGYFFRPIIYARPRRYFPH